MKNPRILPFQWLEAIMCRPNQPKAVAEGGKEKRFFETSFLASKGMLNARRCFDIFASAKQGIGSKSWRAFSVPCNGGT